MKNYVQPGSTLTVPSPATVASGDVVVVGSLIGIAAGDAASGADLDLVTEGVFTLPKVNALEITLGAVVYYDAGTELVTTDDDEGGNPRLGIAVTAAANPSASVNVKLG